ncbi:hypothetical protein [Pedobacter sp. MC2016-24]|uniref:hypothetical protein n=1 Tax=Pedobacter sp. MC2016-24 TaxID=2780090 RepID=UPI00187EB6A5|nr:hypothetical protein [Pedobacter sp. MC2016-24]MBE9601943.1 hypothetical protein [Pedobacter sp. MC2016-24]
MFSIRPITDIKIDLLVNHEVSRNFPRLLDFPFVELYREIATHIKTVEISSECILFDSVQSYNETMGFADPDYWSAESSSEEIAEFWVFGQNGQGDLWLFDKKDQVYFFDHNLEQMCRNNFLDLGLNFGRWLQFAQLNKQLDIIYDMENEISEGLRQEYRSRLNALSELLLLNYPFEL